MATNGLDGANGEERGIFLLARKVGTGLERVIEVPVFILSVLMTGIVLLGVFFRYVVRAPLGVVRGAVPVPHDLDGLLSVALCIWRRRSTRGSPWRSRNFQADRQGTHIRFERYGDVLPLVLTKYDLDGGRRKGSFPRRSLLSMEWWLMAVLRQHLICMIMLACKMILDIRRKNLDEILMSEDIVETVKREEGLDFGDVPLKEAKPR